MKPAEILNLLSELIVGWDLPMRIMPSNDLNSVIPSLEEGEQVISVISEMDSCVNMAVLGKNF